jgi:hypothetical protein
MLIGIFGTIMIAVGDEVFRLLKFVFKSCKCNRKKEKVDGYTLLK